MRRMLRWPMTKFFGPIIVWYLKKDRNYRYKGISIKVKKGVFHPGFFFSTKFILEVLSKYEMEKKSILELGAGSGLISFYLARQGAKVTASDINTIAIAGLLENNTTLHAGIDVVHSDLFEKIPQKVFDYIIINPPYYPREPKNQEEMAWFCGAGFEYFYKLFKQIRKFKQPNTTILMSLSEDCNIKQIENIARENFFLLTLLHKKRIMGELNYIYQIISK